eukprot:363516-Chlamydomonas_euryale.AAC.14
MSVRFSDELLSSLKILGRGFACKLEAEGEARCRTDGKRDEEAVHTDPPERQGGEAGRGRNTPRSPAFHVRNQDCLVLAGACFARRGFETRGETAVRKTQRLTHAWTSVTRAGARV